MCKFNYFIVESHLCHVCLTEWMHMNMDFSDDENFIFTQEPTKNFDDTQSA